MVKFVFILWLFFFLLPACRKPATNCCLTPDVEMTRLQSQCADPWGNGGSGEQAIKNLTDYLLLKNIVTSKITLQSTGETFVCNACSCSSGYRYVVCAKGQYTDSLMKLGFAIKL